MISDLISVIRVILACIVMLIGGIAALSILFVFPLIIIAFPVMIVWVILA